MTSVYIASRYSRKPEMRVFAQQLRKSGFVVTSRWLDEDFSPNVQLAEVSDKELRDIAIMDLHDIDVADSMVFFAEDQHHQPPRGGRHVEFGYALAKGKHVFVVGERENCFHYLPGLKHFATGAEVIAALAGVPAHTECSFEPCGAPGCPVRGNG